MTETHCLLFIEILTFFAVAGGVLILLYYLFYRTIGMITVEFVVNTTPLVKDRFTNLDSIIYQYSLQTIFFDTLNNSPPGQKLKKLRGEGGGI